MQTSRRQALYNTMDSKPRVICCSFERNRNVITVCLKIQPLVQYTAKPRKECKSAEPKYGWEHWLTWLPIVIRRVGSVNYDCDFSRVDETAATRRTGGTEVVGGPTSQSVLFTFDQIKPHEYKITWKITLQPSIDGTQLIKSRSDSRMIIIYIYRIWWARMHTRQGYSTLPLYKPSYGGPGSMFCYWSVLRSYVSVSNPQSYFRSWYVDGNRK